MKILLIFMILLYPHLAQSQAFCSLRTPHKQINKFFPQNNGFETNVGTIDNTISENVTEVTGLKLHKNEIGRHNLYIVKKESNILGLVHSRSDLSQWGLVETVWSINLDLSIADFDFQRCRSSLRSKLLSKEFKSKIIGKSIYDLKLVHSNLLKARIKSEQDQLFLVVITAALKTIAITQNCWNDKLKNILLNNLSKNDDLYLASFTNTEIKKLNNKQEFNLKTHFIIKNDKKPSIKFTPITSNTHEEYLRIKSIIVGASK